ncbi:MAG: exonuclease subunit SbcD [Bacteroidetes bacterium]|nr:exonuclease subunit SbcD [Bacteroidota bacterium]
MKILHTSDWHLGKRLEDFPRLGEQKAVLQEICEIADKEQVHAVIVAGDLFDTYNPPAEAVDMFYKVMKKLSDNGKRAVIAISGNHDSPDRIESPDPLARECGIIFIGYPDTVVPEFELESGLKLLASCEGYIELQLPDVEEPLRIIHTAYANEYRLKTYLGSDDREEQLREVLERKWKDTAGKFCDNRGVNILTGHLFIAKEGAELPEEPEDEKPILHLGGAQVIYTRALPADIQYAAFGHLHRKQIIDKTPCPAVYSGSPLSYSFSEAGRKKYVIVADLHPGEKTVIREIELLSGKKLMRYRAKNIGDAVEWLYNHSDCLVELTIISDTYLTAKDRKLLLGTHDGIVNIIPEIRNKDLLSGGKSSIDLTKSTAELFREYFLHEKGQEPNERIMAIFNEVLSADEKE